MKKFNYKLTRNSLLKLFTFNIKEQKNYSHQFEQVSSNYEQNSREEFAQHFFKKSFNAMPHDAVPS